MRILLLSAFWVVGCSPALSNDLFVRDGDSFALNDQEIRLWGIDAPEYHQVCFQNDKPIPCGKYARQRLENLLTDKDINCKRVNTDRYKRTIARCYVEGVDVAAEMVLAGFAFDYLRYSNGAYSNQQKAAKNECRGLWSMKFEWPWEYKKRKK